MCPASLSENTELVSFHGCCWPLVYFLKILNTLFTPLKTVPFNLFYIDINTIQENIDVTINERPEKLYM